MPIFGVLPPETSRPRHMTWYSTQSYYTDTGLTNYCIAHLITRQVSSQLAYQFKKKIVQYSFLGWRSSWISNQNDFSYFWPTNHLETSNDVSSQLAFWFRIKKIRNRFSTWLLGRPSWISDPNDFSYFWSTSHPNTSYQVSSQFAVLFRRSSKQNWSWRLWQPY